MKKLLFPALFCILFLSSCHHEFAAWNKLGFVPLLTLMGIIICGTIYALWLTFNKNSKFNKK